MPTTTTGISSKNLTIEVDTEVSKIYLKGYEILRYRRVYGVEFKFEKGKGWRRESKTRFGPKVGAELVSHHPETNTPPETHR